MQCHFRLPFCITNPCNSVHFNELSEISVWVKRKHRGLGFGCRSNNHFNQFFARYISTFTTNIVSHIKLDRKEKKTNVGEICFLKICKEKKDGLKNLPT